MFRVDLSEHGIFVGNSMKNWKGNQVQDNFYTEEAKTQAVNTYFYFIYFVPPLYCI